MSTKVVITGLGVVSPVGNDVETFWKNICAGKSGIRLIDQFDTSDLTAKIAGIAEDLTPMKKLEVVASGEGGKKTKFTAIVRIDTPNELDYYRHGGILQFVLRQLAKA